MQEENEENANEDHTLILPSIASSEEDIETEARSLTDKHFDAVEIQRLEDLRDVENLKPYHDLGKHLKEFKETGSVYKKNTSKVQQRIQSVEEETKNFGKIQKDQEKLIAQIVIDPQLPPPNKRSKLHDITVMIKQ